MFREAEATRNALHGVQWPIGNGKKLIIEYSTREELEKAKNPPPPAPIVTETKLEEKEAEVTRNFAVYSIFANFLTKFQVAAVKEPSKEENIRKSEDRREKRKKEMREWDIGKEDLERDRRSRSRDRTERKRHARHSASPVDGSTPIIVFKTSVIRKTFFLRFYYKKTAKAGRCTTTKTNG